MGEHGEMKDSKKECWQEPFFVTGVTFLQHTEIGEQLHWARADCPFLTTLATRKKLPSMSERCVRPRQAGGLFGPAILVPREALQAVVVVGLVSPSRRAGNVRGPP
jgi:hypothetical protein